MVFSLLLASPLRSAVSFFSFVEQPLRFRRGIATGSPFRLRRRRLSGSEAQPLRLSESPTQMMEQCPQVERVLP
jgi:hypothetical protein